MTLLGAHGAAQPVLIDLTSTSASSTSAGDDRQNTVCGKSQTQVSLSAHS